MGIIFRELETGEFGRVETELWAHYHGQTTDPATDRIFGAFDGERLVGSARVRRHPDGCEVDGFFVLDDYRGHGIARKLMNALLEAVGDRILWMHSTLTLVPFYSTFGFFPVSEVALPPTIRARMVFCFGNMEGCGVRPMLREPPATG
ncbi:MAG: GNAT family N-acetyltransferase [Methanomicrobiaceae archaeon]|nr:GNAT family N-acetyltransferase [Methanomicrobiaceae archaeon]